MPFPSTVVFTTILLSVLLIHLFAVPVPHLLRFTLSPSRNIPGPPPTWPVAQLLEKFVAGEAKSREWRRRYGAVYRIHSLFRAEVVITRSSDVRKFHSDGGMHNKSRSSNAGWLFHQLLGECLGLLNGRRWKELRRVFEPHFTHRAINMKTELFCSEAKEFVRSLDMVDGETRIQPSSAFRSYPFWCTATAIYGPMDSGERAELWSLAEKRMAVFAHALRGGVYCFPIVQWLRRDVVQSLRGFQGDWLEFNERISCKRKNLKWKSSIVGIWDQATPARTRETLQTLDEALFANLDVTSFVLTRCILCIAHDERVQTRLRKEVQTYSSELHVYAMKRDTYLHWCVLETMRLYPISAFSMPEESEQSKSFGRWRIPKYTSVIIDTCAINREVAVWGTDSNLYWPERFNFMEKEQLKYSLFGFGLGRRQCLGKHIAETVVRVMLAELVSKFTLRPAKSSDSNQGLGAWEAPSNAGIVLNLFI